MTTTPNCMVSELADEPRQVKHCLSSTAAQVMAKDDFNKVLSNVLVELASSNKSKQAAASAAAAVLLTQAPEGQTLSPNVVPAVLPLLNSGNPLIQVSVASPTETLSAVLTTLHAPQRNACAALIAVAEAEAATLQAELHQWSQAVIDHLNELYFLLDGHMSIDTFQQVSHCS